MKKMNFKNVMVMALVVLLFSGMQAIAQRGPGHPGSRGQMNWKDGDMPGRFSMIPDLTDEQQEQIKSLRLAFADATLPTRNAIREKQARLATLLTEDNVNQSQVNATIDEVSALRSKIMKERVNTNIKIKALLTDEQKVVFNQHIAGRGGRGFGQGDCMGPGMGRRGGFGKGRFN